MNPNKFKSSTTKKQSLNKSSGPNKKGNSSEKTAKKPRKNQDKDYYIEEIDSVILPSNSSQVNLWEIKWEGYSNTDNTHEPMSNIRSVGEFCIVFCPLNQINSHYVFLRGKGKSAGIT